MLEMMKIKEGTKTELAKSLRQLSPYSLLLKLKKQKEDMKKDDEIKTIS